MSQQAQNNTPQGQPQDVIGGGLDAGVIKQLQQREALVSEYSKSKEHLLFFNGNGAWARMVSSVNTISEKEAQELVTNNKTISAVRGDNTLAKQNILMGGVLTDNSIYRGGINDKKYHSPINLSKKGYIDDGLPAPDEQGFGIIAPNQNDTKTNSYHNYESLGFRPSPGIESVDVKSKGTYGTLRDAEVNFKVWTLEDLEVMQKLYLRPGYSVLLEWGHSQQLNSSTAPGTLNSDISTYNNFFDDIEGDLTNDVMLVFEKALKKIQGEADYNYDSFVGYITNFNWSLNNNGGYDCSVKIVAKGAILESIKVTFDPSEVFPANQMSPSETNKGKEERKSIYHKFFKELDKTTGLNSQPLADLNNWQSALRLGNPIGTGVVDLTKYAIVAGQTGNWPLVTEMILQNAQERLTDIDNAGQAVEDVLFGSKAESFSTMNSIDSLEGKFAMENEAFAKKINKLKKGDKFTIPGTVIDSTYDFEGIEERDVLTGGGIAALEEEEVVYYLKKNFSQYGLEFFEGTPARAAVGNYDALVIKAANGKEFKTALDKTLIAESRRDSAAIVDFITENAVLPENQLTPEQKQFREQLKLLKESFEQNRLEQEKFNKENNVSSGQSAEGTVQPVYTKAKFALDTSKHFTENLNDFVAFRLENLEVKDTGMVDNDDLCEFWIPLYTVLDIYNNYVTLIDATKTPSKGTNTPGRKLTQFYTGFQDKELKQDYQKKLKYLTTPLHFSINPMVCVLPSPPVSVALKDSEGNTLTWPDDSQAYPVGQIWKNGFHQQVANALAQGQMRGKPDDILNILVSGQLILDELDKIVAEAEDSDSNTNNNVVYFIRTLLKQMNEAMGGINDLDLFYDEEEDMYFIVDRKVTPSLRNFIPKLSLSGRESTMTNVNISSEISNRIGNMVSIAAQGVGDKSKENIGVLLKWNAGLIDRHIRHKADTSDPAGDEVKDTRDKPEDARLKSWIKDYYDYWMEFNGENWFDDGDWNRSLVSSLGNYHKRYSQKYVVTTYMKGDSKNPLPPPGTIPIELSFDTIGLGGLKIGQAFMIEPGLLPTNYSEEFGYIITGLDQKINGNKWITSVKTQFYSITPPTAAELEYFKRQAADTSEFKTPASVADPADGGMPGPVVPYNPNDARLPGDGSVIINGGSFGQSKLGKRRDPIQQKLMDALEYAAKETGTTFRITSAGNRPLVNGGPSSRKAILSGDGVKGKTSTGSARHDGGWGVDGNILDNNGKKIDIWKGGDIAQTFIRKVREKGVSGVGLGQYYMSGTAIHLDMAAGNSVYGSVYSMFSAGDTEKYGKKAKVCPSFLKPLMKASRNSINRPSGTASNGKTFKVSGP